MAAREGQEYVDQLFKDKQRIQKVDAVFLQNKIDEYTNLIELNGQNRPVAVSGSVLSSAKL